MKLNQARIDDYEDMGPGVAAPGDGLVLLDRRLQPISMDRGGEAILRDLDRFSTNGGGVRSLADEVRKFQDGAGTGPASARIHLRAGKRKYRCSVFLLESGNGATGESVIAVYMRREVALDEAVQRVATAYHVTDREREALIGVAMGLTSKELAERMNISPNTVNAFFRLIMSKMGVTTRAGVVGKLLEQLDVPLEQ